MIRRLFLTVLFLIVVAAVAAGGGWLWFSKQISRDGPHAMDEVVLIPPGSHIQAIATTLVERGIIRSDLLFRLASRLSKADRALKSGEFRIPARASVTGVLDVLTRGETVARTFTIPEGLTVAEALEIVAKADGLMGPLPAPPDEGRLLPETYRYAYYDTKVQAVRRMEQAMDAALAKAWAGRDEGLPLNSLTEALILASIVEKETGVKAERARVAGVFLNRLRKGMKLQSDPTVIYGITEGKAPLGRDLTRADLDTPTPWNTYAVKGLPPTPIANPGLAAIDAVLHPEATKDLYFVADGTGGHAFAETLQGHNRNVAKWRKIQRNGK
ncbi:MAG TPA: endolytic transglycosylase MltG [Rhodospirillaceae bacterium]|nr:aminodeoxychorismate lyase [Magnetovibrio sp.]HBT44153.1 endolytic transglycosylase MltG [Rhodospirillaceae bacterium]HCS68822.1 endolytic transglycosylase MltG [Rhodospirillaceae bacterium]|tara:strand:- start:5508 stop:6491 length:984 start_codon:yes stop_codon:yes gene_type:complete